MTLKELRRVKGLTQEEASELVGIPLRTWKRYENNQSLIDNFKYQQIYNFLAKIPAKAEQNKQKPINITVVGGGYVGLSLSALLSIENNVTIVDINEERIQKINNRDCYLKDPYLEKMFRDSDFSLRGLCVNDGIYRNSEIVIVATNTDFDNKTNTFDMSSVISTIEQVRKENAKCLIVIKSTVPMGFTKSLNDSNIIFCPEFLREGSAVKDNLFPSRIIIGADRMTNKVKIFARCLSNISINNKNIIYMSSQEAEAVKLFSNAYLAMRVAYFNELDTYAETNNLNSSRIIKGVSMDPRIGDQYNNPSFGYGGYCLPKDTAQLENSFLSISNNNIIRAIVESNQTRKEFIVSQIAKKVSKDKTIGFYRLSMKKDSDNYRNSATLDIVEGLKSKGYSIIIYEPTYKGDDSRVVSLEVLLSKSDIIIANRVDKNLNPVLAKVYTRDQFENN